MGIKNLDKAFKSLDLSTSQSGLSSDLNSDCLSSEECCSGDDDPDPDLYTQTTKSEEIRFFTDTKAMREYYEYVKFLKKIEKNKIK